MARTCTRAALGVLLTALMGSCLGGQTGQPDSGLSCAKVVPPSSPIEDTTLAALAQAFAGSHRAALRWEQVEPNGGKPTPLDLSDSIALDVRYEGDTATDHCGELEVPVTLTIQSEATGLFESGPALLTYVEAGMPRTARLSYGSASLSLFATLTEATTDGAPVGRLTSYTSDTPATSAKIGEQP